ncbi:MAG: hypothetical protein JWQ43_4162 [Glaciihabitans sp.]|nr:hypothetical protein [Glaciihabitans sp.]
MFIIVLVIGYFVAEKIARNYAEGYVRERIVAALELPNGDGVGVDLGGGSFLLQAAAGRINTLGVTIDKVDVGELSGAAVVSATGVPLNPKSAVETMNIDFTLDEDQLTTLTKSVSDVELDGVSIDGDVVRVSATLSLYTLSVPISVGLTPGVGGGGGDIVLTPADISVAGQTLTAEAVQEGIFGSIAAPLLAPRSFCVASELPAALTLTGVRTEGKTLVVTLNGDGIVLGGDLSTKGTC